MKTIALLLTLVAVSGCEYGPGDGWGRGYNEVGYRGYNETGYRRSNEGGYRGHNEGGYRGDGERHGGYESRGRQER